MLPPIGENISNLPFGELKIVNELMLIDGLPILIHFSNERDDDILAYWVDYDTESIRWLYTKVTKDELYKYLKGLITLKLLFQQIESEYVFFVDFTSNNAIKNVRLISSFLIPDEYFAGEMSYYPDGLSDFYNDYLYDFEYTFLLKERAYIIKAEPSQGSHRSFLSAKDGAFLLESFSSSIENYVVVLSNSKYEKKITSPSRLNEINKTNKNQLSPLIAAANIHSFEVWLSIDTISYNDADKSAVEIKHELIDGYKKDVLDIDFTSEDDAKIICEKFTPIQRKKIYQPVIDIIKDTSIKLTVSDKNRTIRNADKPIRINQKFQDLILPPPTLEELKSEEEKKKRIYTLFLSLDEGTDISKVKRRDILNNLLLFNDAIETPYPITFDIKLTNGLLLRLNKPIIATLKIKDQDQLEFTSYEFNIDVVAKEIKELIELFKNEFIKRATKVKAELDIKAANPQTVELFNEYIDISKL